jgi:hypothetical protein
MCVLRSVSSNSKEFVEGRNGIWYRPWSVGWFVYLEKTEEIFQVEEWLFHDAEALLCQTLAEH